MLKPLVFNSQSSMHRFVHALAVCMVLFHLVGGCCWHHDHDECLRCCKDEGRTVATLDRVVGDSDYEFHHCHTDCDEEDCAFAAARSRRVVTVAGNLLAWGIVNTEVLRATSDMAPCHSFDGPPPGSSPPLRLHLIHQIILV